MRCSSIDSSSTSPLFYLGSCTNGARSRETLGATGRIAQDVSGPCSNGAKVRERFGSCSNGTKAHEWVTFLGFLYAVIEISSENRHPQDKLLLCECTCVVS